MSDKNKAALRRHVEALWNQSQVVLIDELFASDCLGHAPPDEIQGRDELKRYLAMLRTAFPDLQVTVQDVLAEADRVVARWTARGTYVGELWGRPPTGRQGLVTGISIFRMANGKVVECWASWNVVEPALQHGPDPAEEATRDDRRDNHDCTARATPGAPVEHGGALL